MPNLPTTQEELSPRNPRDIINPPSPIMPVPEANFCYLNVHKTLHVGNWLSVVCR